MKLKAQGPQNQRKHVATFPKKFHFHFGVEDENWRKGGAEVCVIGVDEIVVCGVEDVFGAGGVDEVVVYGAVFEVKFGICGTEVDGGVLRADEVVGGRFGALVDEVGGGEVEVDGVEVDKEGGGCGVDAVGAAEVVVYEAGDEGIEERSGVCGVAGGGVEVDGGVFGVDELVVYGVEFGKIDELAVYGDKFEVYEERFVVYEAGVDEGIEERFVFCEAEVDEVGTEVDGGKFGVDKVVVCGVEVDEVGTEFEIYEDEVDGVEKFDEVVVCGEKSEVYGARFVVYEERFVVCEAGVDGRIDERFVVCEAGVDGIVERFVVCGAEVDGGESGVGERFVVCGEVVGKDWIVVCMFGLGDVWGFEREIDEWEVGEDEVGASHSARQKQQPFQSLQGHQRSVGRNPFLCENPFLKEGQVEVLKFGALKTQAQWRISVKKK